MDVQELAAREAIRDTIARYAQFADGGRFAELAELFTDDGVLEIAGEAPIRGREAIEGFLGAVKERLAGSGMPARIRHHVSSVRIDLAGEDEASAASYFLVVSDRGPDHWGRYRDTLRRVGDHWLFHERKV
ncbi:MAG: nuclear transport factor 2 family protein, partial [Candidatus Binatia bacterium]